MDKWSARGQDHLTMVAAHNISNYTYLKSRAYLESRACLESRTCLESSTTSANPLGAAE